MKKKGYGVFIVLCIVILLIPFAGMAVAPTMTTTENKEMMALPEINVDYMSDMGDYFQEHFAFRQEMVSANAAIYGKVFGASTTDQVVIGKNNWMYFTGTLDDYLVEHQISERGLNNVIHNLKLIQNYAERNGSQFLLAIAPNKNSVYGENMPYYYVRGEGETNYDRLRERMIQEDIHFVDLHKAFEESGEILYLERDSHWTNKGAVLAYNQMMQALTTGYETYENVPYEVRKEHLGDLTEMLYPLNSELENNEYYNMDWNWSYVNEVTDNMDEWIETSNPQKDKILLMYRDSFGESLLPFFAEAFGKGYFTRLVPFDMTNINQYQADYTIVERVERRISSFAAETPIMQAPTVQLPETDNFETAATLEVKAEGGYYSVSGVVDSQYCSDDSSIYVLFSNEQGKSVGYIPFYLSFNDNGSVNDWGYKMYLNKQSIPADTYTVDVIIETEEEIKKVASEQTDLTNID